MCNVNIRLLKDIEEDYKQLEKWYQEKEIYSSFEQRKLNYEEIKEKYYPRTLKKAKIPVYMIEYNDKTVGIIQYKLVEEEDKKMLVKTMKYHLIQLIGVQTLINLPMYEVKPQSGILTRITGNQYEFQMNGGSGSYNKKYNIEGTNRIVIKRKNGIIYVTANDEAFTETKDHTSITNFDTPVTFGCSYTSTNTPQRYFKGTLKNMKVIIYE